MSITPDATIAIIEERLKRPVLDGLEAAVVLEAFAGLDSETALRLGESSVRDRTVRSPASTELRPLRRTEIDLKLVLSDVTFVVGVLLIGVWLSQHVDLVGAKTVDRSWRLALPLSIGTQWFLRRRALIGPDGLGRLRQERKLLLPALVVLVLLSVIPEGGRVAAALAVTWVGGFLVSRRGWGIVHFGLVGVAVIVSRWLDPRTTLAALALVSAVLAAFVLREAPPSVKSLGSLARSIPSGLIGGCLALFLVAEPPVTWGASSLVASLTIVPALLGAVVGGVWMTRIWNVVGRRLASRSVSRRGLVGGPLGVFVAAVGLAATVSASASMAMLWLSQHDPTAESGRFVGLEPMRTLLIAHALLAVAGMSVSLLEALGRWGWALFAALSGAVLAWTLPLLVEAEPEPGARILFGAIVTILCSLPLLVSALCRPAHRVAVLV